MSVGNGGMSDGHRGGGVGPGKGLLGDVRLSGDLGINVGLSGDLLMDVGLGGDLNINVGLGGDLLMGVGLGLDLGINVGLGSNLLMDIGLGGRVQVGVGNAGVVGTSIQTTVGNGSMGNSHGGRSSVAISVASSREAIASSKRVG